MKNLYKDQIRKIRYNLFNFISLSILVIVISLTFTSIQSSVIRLEKNYDPYLEAQNVEDFHFSLSNVDIRILGGTALWYICGELEINYECAYYISVGTNAAMTNLNNIVNQRIEERPDLVDDIIEEYIAEITTEYDFVVEEKWEADVQEGDYNYRFLTLTSTIDIPYLVEGELPDEDYEIALLPEFAAFNNISIHDTITISNQDFVVTAFIYSPDYAFPIDYMNPMDVHYETIVLTNNATIETLNVSIDKQYVAKGDLSQLLDEQTFKEVTETDVSTLGRNTQHLKSIKPATANYKIATLYLEVENAKLFINTFVTVFIVFTGLLFTIFLKRYIDKNKKDIDTLQSLGYSNREITRSLMVFPIITSLMSVIGYGLGLLAAYLIFDSYAGRYLFPKAPFEIYTNIFLLAVVVPVVFICITSFVFISINLIRSQKQPLKRFRFQLFKFTPTKTILQTFALLMVVSIMLVFAINANNLFSTFVETTRVGNNYEEAIQLNYFTDEAIDEDYETFTRLRANILSVNEVADDYSFAIYGINPDTTLKVLLNNNVEGNLLLEEGIIISEYMHYNEGYSLGDIFVFEVKGTEYTYEVVGITNELIENNAFILKEALNESHLLDNTYYNGIYTNDRLYQSDNILARINYQAALEDVLSTMRTSSNILYFIVFLSAIIGLFMFGFIISNYLTENRKSIAILKSIGYNKKEINVKYILVILITFVIAFIVAIPATKQLFDLLLKNIINELGYILILDVTFTNIVISFLLLALVFIFTLFLINRYFEKVTITEILKAEEN